MTDAQESSVPGRIDLLAQSVASGRTSYEASVRQAMDVAASAAAAHVFSRLYPEQALGAARAADAAHRSGRTPGPLAGVPVSIKDLFDVAGEVTCAGSVVCSDASAAVSDAPVVARLRSAGAAIVGRTNMTEFAFSGVGVNPHFGTPRNPADPDTPRVPGGSSSGAAVSVALGAAHAALGTDTGGSIRIPAALCGLVGFKSSQARVPGAGAFPLSRTLDSVCAMAHTVSDCLRLDAVIADLPLQAAPVALAGRRFLVADGLGLEDLAPEVAAAFEHALSRLSAAGALIVRQRWPHLDRAPAINGMPSFAAIEGYAVHRERLEKLRARFDPRVAARLEIGAPVLAADYLAQLAARHAWANEVNRTLGAFDALLLPTVPLLAPTIAELAHDDARFFEVNRLLLRNPTMVNLFDGCAFSLPCQAPGELPVGLMLAASNGRDAALACVALSVESALRQHTVPGMEA